MARIQIGAQQGELFARGIGGDFGAHDVGVALQGATLAAAGHEAVGQDAHRYTGVAALAGRAIGDGLAAAEAGMGQGLGQGLGQGSAQTGKDFPLDPSRQIGAGPTGGEEKLRNACAALLGHGPKTCPVQA